MAITWGSWAYAGNNGQRAGIDLSRSGNTITAKYYVQNQWTHADNDEVSTRSGAIGGTSTFDNYGGSNAVILITTRTFTGTPGNSYTFGHTITRNYHGARPTVSRSISIPASAPNAPTLLMVTRNSDGSQTLAWNRNSTYTAVVVQRSENGGDWRQIGRPTGNAAGYTDTTTKANGRYVYRVAGVNAGGQSGWSNQAVIYTTPAAPTGISAARVGNGIRVSVAGLPPYATHFDFYDGGTLVGGIVPRASLPWTHVEPDAAQPHTFTVRARVTSGGTNSTLLTSVHSAPSNTVQLLAPPLAPTKLAPNGGLVAANDDAEFSWEHVPVDASEQTGWQLRIRRVGGAWETHTGSVAALPFKLSLDAGYYEWQVATSGEYPAYGPWSAVATLQAIDRPGIAVITPTDRAETARITAQWTYTQNQARGQSAWRLELRRGDDLIEERQGSGNRTSLLLNTRFEDSTEYELRVFAATSNIWSFAAVSQFLVEFPPVAIPSVDGVWNEETGTVDLSIRNGQTLTVAELESDGLWYVDFEKEL